MKVIFAPTLMVDEEEKVDELRKAMGSPPATAIHRAVLVQHALFSSFFLVIASGMGGYSAGVFMGSLHRCADSQTITWLQIAGATILLWATLFIRGWEIQSFGGVTLTERVNQWIYRAMCCIGTAVAVYSLAFPACKQ